MTAPYILDPARLLGEALADSSPDLMRQLLQSMINTLLSADADAVAGAEWGKASPDRVAQRNGYRHRDLDRPRTSMNMSTSSVTAPSMMRARLRSSPPMR